MKCHRSKFRIDSYYLNSVTATELGVSVSKHILFSSNSTKTTKHLTIEPKAVLFDLGEPLCKCGSSSASTTSRNPELQPPGLSLRQVASNELKWTGNSSPNRNRITLFCKDWKAYLLLFLGKGALSLEQQGTWEKSPLVLACFLTHSNAFSMAGQQGSEHHYSARSGQGATMHYFSI